jgi:ubiquitin-conjugating enzyme E2 S
MEGIAIEVNEDDMTDIQAVIDGPPGTPYQGGQFRIKLVLSKDFPASPPKAFFLTKIFHPNVRLLGLYSNLLKSFSPGRAQR